MVMEIRSIWTGLGALLFVWDMCWTCIILRRELNGFAWSEPLLLVHLPFMVVSVLIFGMVMGLTIAEQTSPEPDSTGAPALHGIAAKSNSQFPAARLARTNYGTMDEKDLL
jgi:hypothetical protein